MAIQNVLIAEYLFYVKTSICCVLFRDSFSFCRLLSHLIQDLFPLLFVFALGDEAFVIHALELFELRFRALGSLIVRPWRALVGIGRFMDDHRFGFLLSSIPPNSGSNNKGADVMVVKRVYK